ncbi:hypothetical protein V8F06_003874 [Rhypophila decipiens]
MTEPDHSRPGSSTAGHHGPSIPSSPRPSVASRASGSSLRRERERQQDATRPVSVAQSHSHSQSTSPQPPAAAIPLEGVVPDETNAEEETSSFSPFFTLISTSDHPSQKQTTHHPTVHYIFADDDPEVLSAALRQHSLDAIDDEPETGDSQSVLIRPGDRAIILNMASTADGTGLEVASASSLSPDWAVVSTQLTRMEGGDRNTPAGGGEHDAAATPLMLKIEGVSIEASQEGRVLVPWGKTPSPEAELQSSSGSAPPVTGSEEYPGLLSDFDKRMALLRRVVESSAERQRIANAAREGAHEEEEEAQQSMENRTGPSPATAADDNGSKE